MSTRQKTLVALMGALLFGFFFRVGERRVVAVPVSCAIWDCFDTYGWWPDNAIAASYTAEVAQCTHNPPQGTDHRTFAVISFYTPASAGSLPLVQSGLFDKFT